MAIDTPAIIELLKNIAKDKNLAVTVNEAVKCGLIVGGVTVLGAILFGPIGMAVGGCASSCITALTAKSYKSLFEVLMEMEPEKQEALCDNVRNIMKKFDAKDAVVMAGVIAGNAAAKQQVTAEMVNFIKKEMQMAIVER